MKKSMIFLVATICLLQGCADLQNGVSNESNAQSEYLDFSNRDDQFTGGIKMIPISTPKGVFKVWTKRVGNNPSMKLLLLHGGPGGTYEAFQCFDGYLPAEGIEFIYYDQLGSYYSDQPSDTTLKYWDVSGELSKISLPTLVIGSQYDTMDPKHMEWMSEEVRHGRLMLCTNGRHPSHYDKPKRQIEGLEKCIKNVESCHYLN